MAHSKYLEIIDVSQQTKKKTKDFLVKNKDNGTMLGWINWYPPFRKYAFTPSSRHIVFDPNCLKDITEKLESLMEEHKKNKT